MEKDKNNDNINLDDDSRLLSAFFAENTIEVADDGFTERVMQRLPERRSRLDRIWQWSCVAAGVIFFVLTKSWVVLYSVVRNAVASIDIERIANANLMPYIIAMLVISMILGYSLAEQRR
ncbi:MAG: DUF5056 domain-containing protein [Prevotella sp.]|uniref:DUF5056 domain-containing protein n=1 Tax=Prevotella sp. TaxID=59823 RepID=UPI002A34BF5A|nr:DUF5056 domain-containing protein [Prevotella sp.]MDD7317538.1 DUF5056 domain-containing protein [Prevotellaceae bacterium]MDY4020615.1 DUF5056 domain-containing protein [Prevotella sp.]